MMPSVAPWPYSSTTLPPVPPLASSVASTSILRWAERVRVLPLDQVMSSLTRISPLPSVLPLVDAMVTSPEERLVDRVLPEISPPEAAMVKSVGSISQCSAVTVVPSATFTVAAEVSTKPPSAFRVPATFSCP